MKTPNIDFKQIHWYAERARAAYDKPELIRSQYLNVHTINSIDSIEIQYFIEDVPEQNAQLISIRGTDNLTNVKDDSEIVKSKNEKLGIYIHRGFSECAELIYQDLKPNIDPQKKVLLTGHSLGGAVSTLLMMYFDRDAYTVGQSINFGQPKVTNEKGVEKYSYLPLIRVVNEEDFIPQTPPVNLLDAVHGAYQHLGDKLLLLKEKRYVWLDKEEAEDKSIGIFWRNLGHHEAKDHRMDDYLVNIQNSLSDAVEVAYEDRYLYEE